MTPPLSSINDSLLFSGTALGLSDFTTRSREDEDSAIYFQANQGSTACRIEIVDDDIREDDETFTVTIEELSLGNLGKQLITTVTIKDDDGMRARLLR